MDEPGPAWLLRSPRVRHVLAAIAPDPHIGLFGMAKEPFQHAQPRADRANLGGCLIGQDPLIGASLQEFADPEAAGVARRPPRGQRMVGPNHLVTISDVGAGA